MSFGERTKSDVVLFFLCLLSPKGGEISVLFVHSFHPFCYLHYFHRFFSLFFGPEIDINKKADF